MSLDVHPIVEELTNARHQMGSMNTATMTLVLFFENEQIAPWVTERVRAIADKHPSRVIIFDGTKPEGTQHAEPSDARGEWIEIGVRGASPHDLAAALAQLELPEAPVVLVWIAAAIHGDLRFSLVASAAHTVIVSSSVVNADAIGLRDLTQFVESSPEIVVQDLAYLRLAAWQEIVAEFFDDERCLADLQGLCEVELAAGSDSEMYYMLGWLASRLAWTPCGPGEFCNVRGESIRFKLSKEGPPRRLSRVTLKSPENTFNAQVYSEDPNAVCLEITGPNARPQRCAPLHTVDVASLVERAILVQSRDDVFIETLTMAKHILDREGV